MKADVNKKETSSRNERVIKWENLAFLFGMFTEPVFL